MKDTTHDQIAAAEADLKSLVGEPLAAMSRYGGTQVFGFGPDVPIGDDPAKGVHSERALHVSCRWVITGPKGFALRSQDFGRGGGRSDLHAYDFYDSLNGAPPVVTFAEAHTDGGLKLALTKGYEITVTPLQRQSRSYSQWELFLPGPGSGICLALRGRKLVRTDLGA